MFNQRLAYIDRLQLLFVYVFMRNNLETMKNKHEMSAKGKTVDFPCDNSLKTNSCFLQERLSPPLSKETFAPTLKLAILL